MLKQKKCGGWGAVGVLALAGLMLAGTGCEDKKPVASPKPPGKGAGPTGEAMKPSEAPEPGTAKVAAEPKKKRGTIYTATFAEFSAPPEIDAVTWDERGRMMVNGKKFFPIALYDADFEPDYYAVYRDFSFNTLFCARTDLVMKLRESGFYAAAYYGAASRSDNLTSVLFLVGTDSPAHELENPLKQMEAEVKKIREAAPNRPIYHAMAYWEKDKNAYQGTGIYGKDKYEELFKLNDISGPFLYPVPQFKIAEMVLAYDRIKDATGGKKPLFPIQQLFAWRDAERYPTPEELRTMVLLSIVKGADGIGYYSFNRARNGKPVNIEEQAPQLWLSVKETNALAKRLGEFYLASNPTDLINVETKEKDVYWRAEVLGDQALLVISNVSEKEAAVTINVKGDSFASFCRVDNGEPYSVGSGQINLSVPALTGVAITTDRNMVLPTPGR
jgi:hypothetical protein